MNKDQVKQIVTALANQERESRRIIERANHAILAAELARNAAKRVQKNAQHALDLMSEWKVWENAPE